MKISLPLKVSFPAQLILRFWKTNFKRKYGNIYIARNSQKTFPIFLIYLVSYGLYLSYLSFAQLLVKLFLTFLCKVY